MCIESKGAAILTQSLVLCSPGTGHELNVAALV